MPPESWSGGARRTRRARPAPAARPRAPAARVLPTPCSSSGSSTFPRPSAIQQPGLLERDAVVLVEPGLPGGLAAHPHGARRSAAPGRRPAAAASTCRSPDGPISETNSPAARVRSMPVERDDTARAGRERLADASLDGRPSSSRRPQRCRRRAAHRDRSPVARQREVEQADQARRDQAEHGGAEEGGVQLRRVAGGRLGVLDDQPADAAAGARGDLGDDRADHRGGRGQPERRDQVRDRRRQPQPQQRGPPARGQRREQLDRRRGRRPAARAARRPRSGRTPGRTRSPRRTPTAATPTP